MRLGDWATYQGQLGLVTRISGGWVSLCYSLEHSMCGAPNVQWVRDGDPDVRAMLERAEAALVNAEAREESAARELGCAHEDCGQPESMHHAFVPGPNYEDAKKRKEQAGEDWTRALAEHTEAKRLAFGRKR